MSYLPPFPNRQWGYGDPYDDKRPHQRGGGGGGGKGYEQPYTPRSMPQAPAANPPYPPSRHRDYHHPSGMADQFDDRRKFFDDYRSGGGGPPGYHDNSYPGYGANMMPTSSGYGGHPYGYSYSGSYGSYADSYPSYYPPSAYQPQQQHHHQQQHQQQHQHHQQQQIMPWPSSSAGGYSGGHRSDPIYRPAEPKGPPKGSGGIAAANKTRQYSFGARKMAGNKAMHVKPKSGNTAASQAAAAAAELQKAKQLQPLPEEKPTIKDPAITQMVALSLSLLDHRIALVMAQLSLPADLLTRPANASSSELLPIATAVVVPTPAPVLPDPVPLKRSLSSASDASPSVKRSRSSLINIQTAPPPSNELGNAASGSVLVPIAVPVSPAVPLAGQGRPPAPPAAQMMRTPSAGQGQERKDLPVYRGAAEGKQAQATRPREHRPVPAPSPMRAHHAPAPAGSNAGRQQASKPNRQQHPQQHHQQQQPQHHSQQHYQQQVTNHHQQQQPQQIQHQQQQHQQQHQPQQQHHTQQHQQQYSPYGHQGDSFYTSVPAPPAPAPTSAASAGYYGGYGQDYAQQHAAGYWEPAAGGYPRPLDRQARATSPRQHQQQHQQQHGDYRGGAANPYYPPNSLPQHAPYPPDQRDPYRGPAGGGGHEQRGGRPRPPPYPAAGNKKR